MRTIPLRPIVCVLLFLVATVTHVRAQDDDYEEYFVEDPYGEQLERTLDTPLNLDNSEYSENGTSTMPYVPLTMLKAPDDLTEGTNVAKQDESPTPRKKRTFRINWGNFMLASFSALAGGAAAYYGDFRAKEERDKDPPLSKDEFEDRVDAAKNWQIVRGIGYGLTVVGLLGVVITIAF